MTILHLRSSEFFGGPERAIIGQCRYYKNARLICASFLRPGASSDFLDRCAGTGVLCLPIEERFTGDFGVIKRLVNLIGKESVDLIVTHDYKANFFGRFAAKRTGIKQAAHFRGRTTEDRKVLLYNWLDNRVLKRIGHILVVSEKSRELLTEIGVPPDRLIVVPNGFDMSRSIPEKPESKYTGPFRIVAAGRLSREKGYDILVDSLAILRKKTDDFQVSIYGVGPEENALRAQVKGLALDRQITLSGFVDDLLPVFREADLMVLPSRSEGMPNVVLEAWSQHLPVVAAAVGGLPEMIQSGHNGLLAEPVNPGDLAEKINEALSDRSQLNDFGRAGYETLVERYSFQRQALLLDQIYRRILEQG